MSWPLSQDYNEAVQSPVRNFADPDLRGSKVVVNALGLPLPCSGNFADVYEVRGADGQRWAVKCFTREVVGLHQRYEAISSHLRQAKLPFTVDFNFLEEGIRVRGRWFPVLKMQWVEGLTLNQFVGRYADKPASLESLLQIWLRLSKYLRAARVSHCDLQHGNVLLVPGTGANSLALKLVDYDGMWVPALAGSRSGEVGHPSYQHPHRLRDQTYSLDVDRFPLLLIATGLRAVMVQGRALWDKYDNGDNILFRQSDLLAPTKSFLFLDLVRSADPLTASLADHLLRALRGGVAAAPLLEAVIPETPAPPVAVRAARPVAVPVGDSRGDTAVAVAAPAIATARSRAIVRRPARKAGRVRVAAWVVMAALLLAGFGAGWGLYHAMQNDHGAAATEPALAQHRPDAEPETVPTQRVSPQPAATEPGQEEKETKKTNNPLKPANPDRPKDTEKSKPPVKPSSPPSIEKSMTNSLDMRLIGIPAGKFLMGSPAGETGRNPNEGPRHEVQITRGFYLGEFLVTHKEFAAFVEDARYQTEAEKAGDEKTWLKPGFDQGDNDPVVGVTWNDAVKFCEWLSQKEGNTYSLPTEAQWEYACRAGKQTAYFFGDDPAKINDYAWYVANSDKRAHAVGGMPHNAWGLYDMAGNASQWCWPAGDSVERVLRGGDFTSPATACRCAARWPQKPDQRTNHSGFRVVYEP
jgi:formylglycine-generating enzyme required for sulfatase activity